MTTHLALAVHVGLGEALDRLSILSLKSKRINDIKKVEIVKKDYQRIKNTLEGHGFRLEEGFHGRNRYTKAIDKLYYDLLKVNSELWDIEDKLRVLDSMVFKDKATELQISDYRVIEYLFLARSVYKLNDERSSLKGRIDKFSGLGTWEVKSYNE